MQVKYPKYNQRLLVAKNTTKCLQNLRKLIICDVSIKCHALYAILTYYFAYYIKSSIGDGSKKRNPMNGFLNLHLYLILAFAFSLIHAIISQFNQFIKGFIVIGG